MLLGPKDGEQFGDPDMDRSEAVETGVAAGADRDEQIGIAVAGMPVMNMKEAGLPAAGAPIAITGQHDFAVPAEVIPRVSAGPITAGAETGDGRDSFAADAEERLLPESPPDASPQEAFLTVGEG